MTETDAEFVADMEWLHSHDREAALPPEKLSRLFTLARRGAAVQWRPISEVPKEPMPVLYYSVNRGAKVAPLGRDENFDLGFYADCFCWAGTGHAVFQYAQDRDDPWMPTHWMPLPPPPAGEQE